MEQLLFATYAHAQESNLLLVHHVQDPTERLGSVDGAIGVKQHSYFANTNWDLLEQVSISKFYPFFTSQGKVKPPFVPKLKNDLDTSCFDAEFTELKPEITKIKLSGDEQNQCKDNFPGFSFTAFRF